MSARKEDIFFVTPSGISLRDMTPESIVIVERDNTFSQGKVPSKEFGIHRSIFNKRDDVNVVCHVHGSYIIAASTLLEDGPNSLPPLTSGFSFLAYPLPLLPFYVPGSPELAQEIDKYFTNNKLRALLLRNHGLLAVGKNMSEALNVAEEVDEAARVYVLTSGKGSRIPENLVPRIS